MKLFLLIPCIAVTFSFGACERNPKKTGTEFLPDMVHSIPYDAFSPNPVTPDGKTLQEPSPGSIPRGFLPYHDGNTPIKNPIPLTSESLARGKKVYETFCLVCHGEQGRGDGPLIPKFPNPPSFTSKNIQDIPEGKIFHIITRGSGMMASYASQISPEDRWKVVQYVETLQHPKGKQEEKKVSK